MQAVGEAASSRDWRARGFSFGVWIHTPGRTWRDFVHASDGLVMPVEGKLEVSFGGRTWQPAAGEEVLIPARESRTVRNVGTTGNRWLSGYREG
jgi:ethanolamine utilization protein EutQ (cupin superfamily)